MKVAYYYSLSSAPWNYPEKHDIETKQMDWIQYSIESLKDYNKNAEIFINYTPPYDDDDREILKSLGTLIETDNIIKNVDSKFSHFHQADRVVNRANAAHIKGYDKIVSLDNDIKILNIDELLELEYNVVGMLGYAKYAETPYLSIRFLIFESPFHIKINNKWYDRYVNDQSLKYWSLETTLYKAAEDYNATIKNIPEMNSWFIHHNRDDLLKWLKNRRIKNANIT